MHFHVWKCLFWNFSARDISENQLPEVAQYLRVSERLIPSCLYLGLLVESICTKEMCITLSLALTHMTGCIREVPEMLYNLNDLALWPFHYQLNLYWWRGWLHDYTLVASTAEQLWAPLEITAIDMRLAIWLHLTLVSFVISPLFAPSANSGRNPPKGVFGFKLLMTPWMSP